MNLCFFRLSYEGTKDVVSYKTISPKDLAKSVLDEAGWSNIVVSFPLPFVFITIIIKKKLKK
jgi:hypothetical protein